MKKIKKKEVVIVYPGRFNPVHTGHMKVWDNLAALFPTADRFIATSNKVDKNSPLNFKQKKRLITKAFGISHRSIINCKQPYVPEEIMQLYDKRRAVFVLVIGQKDKERLKHSDKFQYITQSKLVKGIDNLRPVEEVTYVLTHPMQESGKCASMIRKFLKSGRSQAVKMRYFEKLYRHVDQEVFDILTSC